MTRLKARLAMICLLFAPLLGHDSSQFSTKYPIHWSFLFGSLASYYRQKKKKKTWKKSGCSMLAHLFDFFFFFFWFFHSLGFWLLRFRLSELIFDAFKKDLRIFIDFSNFSPWEWWSTTNDPSKIRNGSLIQYSFNNDVFVAEETDYIFEEQWW